MGIGDPTMNGETPPIVPCIYKENTRCAHLQCVVVDLTKAIGELRTAITTLIETVRGW